MLFLVNFPPLCASVPLLGGRIHVAAGARPRRRAELGAGAHPCLPRGTRFGGSDPASFLEGGFGEEAARCQHRLVQGWVPHGCACRPTPVSALLLQKRFGLCVPLCGLSSPSALEPPFAAPDGYQLQAFLLDFASHLILPRPLGASLTAAWPYFSSGPQHWLMVLDRDKALVS